MKRITYIFAAAALMAFAASCQVEPVQQEPVPEETVEIVEPAEPIIFTASLELPPAPTRAIIDGDTPKWTDGDYLTVFAFMDGEVAGRRAHLTSAGYFDTETLSGGVNSATVDFTFSGSLSEDKKTSLNTAYSYMFSLQVPDVGFPRAYGEDMTTISSDTDRAYLQLYFPGWSSYGWNTTRIQTYDRIQGKISYSHNRNLSFKNLWHLLKFTPGNPFATRAILTSLDGSTKIAYNKVNFYFDTTTGNIAAVAPVVGGDAAQTFINLDLDDASWDGTNYYFALIPGITMPDGFKIELKNESDVLLETFTYSNSFTTVRNKLTTISNFDSRVVPVNKAILKDGQTFNCAIKTLAAGSEVSDYRTADASINSIVVNTRNGSTTGTLVSAAGAVPVYATYSAGTLTLTTASNKVYLPADGSYAFYNLIELTSVDLTKISFDDVTNASYMFSSCVKLSSLGAVSLPSATNVSYMFNYCQKLATIGTVRIPVATNANSMFRECDALTSVVFNGTSALSNISYMFQSCDEILSISGLSASGITNAQGAFVSCKKLPSLDISGLSGTITNVLQMFQYCRALESITFSSGFVTTSLTSMKQMFAECNALETISGLNLSTTSLSNTNEMFKNCYVLASIDVSGLSGNLSDIGYMFSNCRALTSIHLPDGFNTNNVSTYTCAFYNCSSLSELYVRGFQMNKSKTSTSYIGSILTNVPDACTIHYTPAPSENYYDPSYYLGYSQTSGTSQGPWTWTTE